MDGEEDGFLITLGGTTLRKSDLATVGREGGWVNDAVISFYFEYLDERVAEAEDRIGFVMPTQVFMATSLVAGGSPEAVGAILGELELDKYYSTVVIPVNDKSSVTDSIGGSHWSLLVYSADDRSYTHYDSAGGSNRSVARRVMAAMELLLDPTGEKGDPTFVDLDENTVPQQGNGCDCGVFLLHFAHNVAARVSVVGDESRLSRMRSHVVRVVDDLVDEIANE